MQAFRDQIVDQQRAAGVRVIKPPHALGFLDPDLPRLGGDKRGEKVGEGHSSQQPSFTGIS
jgi:hypothetical protein